MHHAQRLAEWIDLAADLLDHPQSTLPAHELARQFGRSFDVVSVSWEWRRHPNVAEYLTYSGAGEPIAYPAAEWHADELLNRHPLVRWYGVTGSLEPQTIGRVPTDVSPRRDREFVAELLRRIGADQQMAVPYDVDSANYGVFVLGRPDVDFRKEDLELAGDLQRLLQVLHRRTTAAASTEGQRRVDLSRAAGLTATELAVLRLLAEGHTAYGIGVRLTMAPGTASKHAGHIYRKLGVHDRLAAVLVAQEMGLLPPTAVPVRRDSLR